jgi:hypothetical protein
MKCNRCDTQIGRADPFVVFYARFSNGNKQTFVLCKNCSPEFAGFMRNGKPAKDAAENPTKEKP